MPKVKYEEMLPHEIVARRNDCPIAYVALGGVEWHGEHLAVGNDTLKAEKLAELCALKGGMRMPALYWGEPRETHMMEANHDSDGKIAEKMDLPADSFAPGHMMRPQYDADRAYIELLFHILRQCESLGFQVITLIAGHYPLIQPARAACDWYALDGKARAWACSGYELVKDVVPDAGDHAAKWETSLLMALRPECVDMSRLPDDPDEKLIGVGGIDPRGNASVEYGRKGAEIVVERISEEAHNLLGPWPPSQG